jgi:hypothetical protein
MVAHMLPKGQRGQKAGVEERRIREKNTREGQKQHWPQLELRPGKHELERIPMIVPHLPALSRQYHILFPNRLTTRLGQTVAV